MRYSDGEELIVKIRQGVEGARRKIKSFGLHILFIKPHIVRSNCANSLQAAKLVTFECK